MTKRLSILILLGLTGLLAGCGSSTSNSGQPNPNKVYSVVVSPAQLTLNSGDFASISAIVFVSENNGTPKALSPQPALTYFSSDPRVTVSPAGEVCAGQWDSRYITCSPTATLPSGFVTVTAFDAAHNVRGTVQVSVHARAARITLSSDWGGLTCISQNHQVQYTASAIDTNGNPISSCTTSPGAPGCIHENDYTWSTESSAIAQASTFGVVVARNPGVTNVVATLNGTASEPLVFVTCPPKSIVLTTSPFTGTTPAPPFTTNDVTPNKGDQKYVNASLVDKYLNPLVTSPLTFVTSNRLTASIVPALELSSKLTASTAGRVTITAACEPPSCNPAVANFISPAGPQTGQAAGFGFPIYSNVVGATVQGITGSTVLVTGATFSDGVTEARRLLVFDSESLALNQIVALGNVPNSLVVAPDGVKAYLGSCAGLIVVDLNSYQSSLQTFPVAGQPSTAVVTGKVLAVSPDSRYVVVSDNACPSIPTNPASPANHLVYLIDTTGTKTAARFQIPNITSATFAADGSNIWLGGDAGVFVFEADTFVPIPTNASSHVTSMAWMPDGQSYFASGDQLVDYSTCENRNPQAPSPNLVSTAAGGLATTAIGGVPHLLGLDDNVWFDYSLTTSAQVPSQTVQALSIPPLVANGSGDVCLSTVAVNAPVTAAATLQCTAQQVSFSPKLEEAFVTGVDAACATSESVIHGYNAATHALVDLTPAHAVVPLSGGVLNDGRKLFFGSFDGNGAVLHRIDLATSTGAPGTHLEDGSVTVGVKPTFVAVVPR